MKTITVKNKNRENKDNMKMRNYKDLNKMKKYVTEYKKRKLK